MATKMNSYQRRLLWPDFIESVGTSREIAARVFKYSCFASLAVASAVGFAVFLGVGKVSPTRPAPLDPLKVIFIFSAALPNLFACWLYGIIYCLFTRTKESPKLWLAVVLSLLFGVISGLIFNALSAITIIEYLFDW